MSQITKAGIILYGTPYTPVQEYTVPRRFPTALSALLLLCGACLTTGPDANAITLDFDFGGAALNVGWEFGGADFPVDRATEVNLDGGDRIVPGTASLALYQSGTNVTGDLFTFQRKYLTGLAPAASYSRITLQVGFVTNIHSGCSTGVGPSVVIKGGVLQVEPRADADAQGIYRMNIDKGTGTSPGLFTQLGDIRNGLSGCPATGTYAVNNTARITQSTQLTIDFQGGFWIFLGTQSSFAGRHEIYLTQLRLVLSP